MGLWKETSQHLAATCFHSGHMCGFMRTCLAGVEEVIRGERRQQKPPPPGKSSKSKNMCRFYKDVAMPSNHAQSKVAYSVTIGMVTFQVPTKSTDLEHTMISCLGRNHGI